MKSGLALKIAAGYLVFTFLISAALGLSFYVVVKNYLVVQARAALRQDAQSLAQALSGLPLEREAIEPALFRWLATRPAERFFRSYYVVLDAAGRVVATNLEERFPPGSTLPEGEGFREGRPPRPRRHKTLLEQEFVLATAPIFPGGRVIMFSRQIALQAVRRDFLLVLFESLAWTVPLALLAAWLLARHIARPLVLLRERIHRVARREFDDPQEVRTGDEIEDLWRDFNLMVQRLAEYDRAQRLFLQNASHELKAPLMNIQGYAEGIREGVFKGEEAAAGLEVIAAECQRLKKLVEEIIYLSRMETPGEAFHFEDLDLSGLVRQAAESLQPLARERRLTLEVHAPPQATVRGDRERLRRLVVNLAENALRHAKSRVEFAVEVYPEAVSLVCRDDGEGFLPQEIPRIFERFYKGPRGSTGLGLAIVRAVAEGHGGSVEARNAPQGGAELEVRLPRSEGR